MVLSCNRVVFNIAVPQTNHRTIPDFLYLTENISFLYAILIKTFVNKKHFILQDYDSIIILFTKYRKEKFLWKIVSL